MRRPLLAFVLGVAVLEVVSVSSRAALVPRIVPMPPSLKAVTLPKPVGISDYVKNEAAAIALGKALFWDMQAGSDGTMACATCHYQAGADGRATNQLNAGANGVFDAAKPNHKLLATDFPFHKLADETDRNSTVLRDRDDVVGSQGVHAAMFNDVIPGARKDNSTLVPADPMGFQVGGVNVRRVTGRNTPTVINAAFNLRNFWDGRASRVFNGRNPFGETDSSARNLMVNDLGELVPMRVSLDLASTASQAVGPPLSDVEMSAGGRTFMKLGKKMLSLQPLAFQEVKVDDSVLGPYSAAPAKGLKTTYADMVRAAFQDKWWNSNKVVDGALTPIPGKTVPTDGSRLATDQYTLMESNFSLFWGLAIAAYEATLVSDDSPYDQFRDGNPTAISKQQQMGVRVFTGLDGGNCMGCHAGPEFTGAGITTRLDPIENDGGIQRMIMADRVEGIYDGGYYNIGVRPQTEDIGLAASDPFGYPLSEAMREAQFPGSVKDNKLWPPMQPGERIAAMGTFKTPSLRNVELTGPYFHNGGMASLQDVVEFYTRGGDFHETNIQNLDADLVRQRGLMGHPARQLALLNFLRSLTDDRVRYYRAPFDHPELTLPNGTMGTELTVLQDLTNLGAGVDATLRLPATGRSGQATAIRPFLNLPVFSATSLPAPNPTIAELALFATDSITCASRLDLDGDIWCNGGVRLSSRMSHNMKGDIVGGTGIQVTGDSLLLVGNLVSKSAVRLSTTTMLDGVAVDNAEYYAPLAMPALPVAPTLPLIQTSVVVPANGFQVLQPGRYGTLMVNTGGWVVLQPGTYVFKRITLGINAFLQYDPDGQVDMPEGVAGEMPIHNLEKVIVHTDDIDIARGAIISNGDVRLSTHFKMYVRTRNSLIRMNLDSHVHGSIIAPTARFVMQNGSTLHGAIYARTIDIAETAQFSSHVLAELPRPIAIGFKGIQTGPPAPGDVEDSQGRPGLVFELGQNSPNPVRMNTVMRFALPAARNVELRVFDVAGRAVRTIANGPMAAGVHTLQWDATDDHGARLSSGVYFYRLTAGSDRAMRKMVIVD